MTKNSMLILPVDPWVNVADRLPALGPDFVFLNEDDHDRYSQRVLVFDEDEGEVLLGIYDGRVKEWTEAESGCRLQGVTHWRPLPAAPVVDSKGRA